MAESNAELVAVRLNAWLARFPFYCMPCASELAAEKGWDQKRMTDARLSGQAAVPIIRMRDGKVRHVRVVGSLSKRDWKIDDDDLSVYNGRGIASQMLRLGLRPVRAMPRPVGSSVKCNRCRTRIADLPAWRGADAPRENDVPSER